MSDKPSSAHPRITCCRNGPYLVEGLSGLIDSDGSEIALPEQANLCRCGRSKERPFCDLSHIDVGFDDSADCADSTSGAVKSRHVHEYAGREVTIVDDRRICSHDESCLRELPAVFDRNKKPWIDPDGAGRDEIIRVVKMCPSGALSYKVDGRHHDSIERPPRVIIAEGGPLKIEGAITLNDPSGNRPTSLEHYTLCRCGESRNKPFCDGSHFFSSFS